MGGVSGLCLSRPALPVSLTTQSSLLPPVAGLLRPGMGHHLLEGFLVSLCVCSLATAVQQSQPPVVHGTLTHPRRSLGLSFREGLGAEASRAVSRGGWALSEGSGAQIKVLRGLPTAAHPVWCPSFLPIIRSGLGVYQSAFSRETEQVSLFEGIGLHDCRGLASPTCEG